MSAAGAMERRGDVLEALLAAGADPRAVSELGWNAFHAAVDVGGPAANDEPLVRSILGMLARLGVDIEHRNHAGQTPLLRAILEGRPIEVRVLLELGADPNGRAGECKGSCRLQPGEPALMAAVGNPEKLEILLGFGADPLATDREGRTALDLARDHLRRYPSRDMRRCVEILGGR
jgi:ankyrin repeat protein